MAMPSAVTLGSLAFVAVAGIGLAVVVTADDDAPTSTVADTGPTQPSADKTPEDAGKPDHRRRHESTDAVPKTLVDVFNNSGVSGLAADRATYLQGAGWNVAGTDNWYGDIADNTVYFPPKMRADAATLADALGYDRVRPAVSPMQFDRLTVIITSAS
jgi:hypothetical protein